MKLDTFKYIEEILSRGIQWYDYSKMDEGAWNNYFNDAQFIAKNEVFNNELNHYITDLLKFAAIESKDFDQVLHTRTAIITLETFKQRFESIVNPLVVKSKDNPHDAI